jgi:hypothetical protein
VDGGRESSWLALSSPARDRPLVPTVERIARRLRIVTSELAKSVDLDFVGLYAPRRPGLGFSLTANGMNDRAAWALMGEWLVGFATGHHDGTASIADTHEWFLRGYAPDQLRGIVGRTKVPTLGATALEVRALLPYLLDRSSVATRRSVIGDHATQEERLDRKKSGAYYTPGDVAAHMVRKLLAPELPRPTTWIDPAQGSGVFLRAVLAMSDQFELTRQGLYGIDIDPYAAEAAAFVLASEDLLHQPDGPSPHDRWHHYRRNLATGDSLFLAESSEGGKEPAVGWQIGDVFPEVANGRFSRVLANPPYTKLPPNEDNWRLRNIHPVTGGTASADVSPIFVELGLELLEEHGAMSVVLPLSAVVSSRSPFPQLRVRLAESDGRVDFESFDRVPDALFGDDIKTRNSVITVTRGVEKSLTSTPLHRWTSRNREQAFVGVPKVVISDLPGTPEVLPKIGTNWERTLYLACREHPRSLGTWITNRRTIPVARAQFVDNAHWSRTIALAPTAYNFLGLTRDATQAASDGHDSENPVALLSFAGASEASAAYALLASRLSFWLWHVTGDGFHTTSKLPLYVPAPASMDTIEHLSNLGEGLWEVARANPLVSLNRGKTTVSYPTWVFGGLVDQIDQAIDEMLGTNVASKLADWHERLVVVDTNSNRTEIMMRKTR